jgi:DNA-binding MarR family transcriptional regulator
VSAGADDLALSYVIGRLERVVRRALNDRLAAHDLTVPAFTALSVLRRRPGLSNAQLARRALVTPQSMNELIQRMLERGLIERSVDPNHNRVLRTRLSPSGAELVAHCEAEARELEGVMLDGVPLEDRDRLLELLRVCARNMGAGL